MPEKCVKTDFMKLYNADCFDILPTIDHVDMILMDPPYGCTQNAWDVKIDWRALFMHLKRISNLIVTFADIRTAAAMINAEPKWFRYEWIYEKTNPTGFLNANRMPLKAHENVLVFYGHLPSYHPQFGAGKPYAYNHNSNSAVYGKQRSVTGVSAGRRYPRDVLRISHGPTSNAFHPTEKSLRILEYLIKTYTDPGDTVLDCFMGSGSTGHACINLGRNFIGIEKDETYFNGAVNRLNSLEFGRKLNSPDEKEA